MSQNKKKEEVSKSKYRGGDAFYSNDVRESNLTNMEKLIFIFLQYQLTRWSEPKPVDFGTMKKVYGISFQKYQDALKSLEKEKFIEVSNRDSEVIHGRRSPLSIKIKDEFLPLDGNRGFTAVPSIIIRGSFFTNQQKFFLFQIWKKFWKNGDEDSMGIFIGKMKLYSEMNKAGVSRQVINRRLREFSSSDYLPIIFEDANGSIKCNFNLLLAIHEYVSGIVFLNDKVSLEKFNKYKKPEAGEWVYEDKVIKKIK